MKRNLKPIGGDVRFIGGFAVAILFFGLAANRLAYAQGQTPSGVPLAFEVAAIKKNVSGTDGWGSNSTNGLLRITNATLQAIIGYAYNVRDFQISGGPGWLQADRYDITAKAENGAHDRQTKQMLQTLLADRFQLQFHRETRDGGVYALFVGKNGAKLQPAKSPNSTTSHSSRSVETGRTTLTAEGFDMERLAADLSGRLGRPVMDKTGLTGKFDFELSWTPDQGASSSATAGNPPPLDLSGPSIFTAIQEQLGLRLESQKGPVEVFVIDHAEKPAEEKRKR